MTSERLSAIVVVALTLVALAAVGAYTYLTSNGRDAAALLPIVGGAAAAVGVILTKSGTDEADRRAVRNETLAEVAELAAPTPPPPPPAG